MASFSRFYNAPNYQYTPQFVEQNLGVLDKALARKQDDYDKQSGLLDQYKGAILKQDALIGRDTEVRDKLVKDVQDFSSSMTNLDLTSPENKRKVNEYIQGLINNEDIKKLNQGLASKAKYDKIKEDLLTKGDYATENDRVFMKEFENYLTQPDEGGKFAIDYIGGKELIEKNAPAAPKLKEMINDKIGSSYVYDSVQGTWKHKTTREALTDKELRGIMKLNAEPFLGTTEGRQLARRAEMRMEQDPNWSLEKQYWLEADPIIAEQTYSKNKDEFTDISGRALNLQKLEELKPKPLVFQPFTTKGYFEGKKNLIEYNKTINTLRASGDPKDMQTASNMEAQKEIVLDKFAQSLTPKKRAIFTATFNDIKDKPNLIKEVFIALNPKNSLDADYSMKEMMSTINSSDKNLVDQITKMKLGEYMKIPYQGIEEELNGFIDKAGVFEKQQILTNASKKSDVELGYLTRFANRALNDINFTARDKDGNIVSLEENLVSTLNPKSWSTIRGNREFAYKVNSVKTGSDGQPLEYQIEPKQPNSEVNAEFLEILSGGNKEISKTLLLESNSAQYPPVASYSKESQSSQIGLDPKKDGNWNFPQEKGNYNKVNIKNLDGEKLITNDIIIKKANQLLEQGDLEAVKTLLTVTGLQGSDINKAFINSDTKTITINSSEKNKPVSVDNTYHARAVLFTILN